MKTQLKRNYVLESLERHKHDPKRLWKTIRSFWPGTKSKSSKINNINGLTDKQKIAETLNQHFCDIGPGVQRDINTDKTAADYPLLYLAPVFEFDKITTSDVTDSINQLSSSMSCGIDGITSLLVKTARHALCPILCHLFNQSANQRIFPDVWKFTTITPLFKEGDNSNPHNYRPISILPTLGKVIERIIHKQCTTYLESNDILSNSQSGFRKSFSTGTCLSHFLDNIYQEVDRGVLWGCSSWT